MTHGLNTGKGGLQGQMADFQVHLCQKGPNEQPTFVNPTILTDYQVLKLAMVTQAS